MEWKPYLQGFKPVIFFLIFHSAATTRLKKQKKPAQDSRSMYKYVTKLVTKYENKNQGKGANQEKTSQEEDVAVYREKNTNIKQTLQVQEDGVAE